MRAILTYHSIDSSGSPISIDAETFRRHVEWLASATVRVTTVRELTQLPADEHAVAITFDDGFVNFRDTAWTLLREHDLPVTLFVATDHVGGRNDWLGPAAISVPDLPLLDWESLAALAEQGVEIGSHSRSHRDLRLLGEPELHEELVGSAESIERATGRRPTIFAYPYGSLNARVALAAAETYSLACTTELRPLRSHEQSFRLPRLDVYYFRQTARLRWWGRPRLRAYLAARCHARRARQLLEGLGVLRA